MVSITAATFKSAHVYLEPKIHPEEPSVTSLNKDAQVAREVLFLQVSFEFRLTCLVLLEEGPDHVLR